jgi:hypothetical protein
MRWTARVLGLVYAVFASYFWLFYYEPWLLPAAVLLSVLLIVALAVAWRWPGRSPELLGGIYFILLGLALVVHFVISSGGTIFCSEPLITALCFPPLAVGVLFVVAYGKAANQSGE